MIAPDTWPSHFFFFFLLQALGTHLKKYDRLFFCNRFDLAETHRPSALFKSCINLYKTQLVCFSNLRLFIISVTDYIEIVADFYRSLLSAHLSVNIKISAREEGISSLSCRLRQILGSHFEFLFTEFKPRDQIAKRVN